MNIDPEAKILDWAFDKTFQNYVLAPNQDPESRDLWEAYFSEHPEDINLRDQAKLLIVNLKAPKKVHSFDDVNEKWKATLKQGLSNRDKKYDNRIKLYSIWAIAASLLILVSFGFYLNTSRFAAAKYVTQAGEIKTITLLDGSVITLNGNSSLLVSSDFSKTNRQVQMEGEAFFEIAKHKDNNNPVNFTIDAGFMKVTVLGTKFNIVNRSKIAKMALKEGKVKLTNKLNDEQVIVDKPGQTVLISTKNVACDMKIAQSKPEHADEWRQAKRTLDNTPVSELLDELSNTYGYMVMLNDENIQNIKLSGSIPTTSPKDLIFIIEKTTGSVCIIKQDTLVFSK